MSTTPQSGKLAAELRLRQARAALESGPKTIEQLAAFMGLSIRNTRSYARAAAVSVTLRKPEGRGRWTPVYSLEPGPVEVAAIEMVPRGTKPVDPGRVQLD